MVTSGHNKNSEWGTISSPRTQSFARGRRGGRCGTSRRGVVTDTPGTGRDHNTLSSGRRVSGKVTLWETSIP